MVVRTKFYAATFMVSCILAVPQCLTGSTGGSGDRLLHRDIMMIWRSQTAGVTQPFTLEPLPPPHPYVKYVPLASETPNLNY